jgi:hypothetical protein
MDIRIKSTGMLIDELITARMKIIANPSEENTQRAVSLENAIQHRLQNKKADISVFVNALTGMLKECWDAQEIVSNSDNVYDVYHAAKVAQQTNSVRNSLIREIDAALGEEAITPLEKTYT